VVTIANKQRKMFLVGRLRPLPSDVFNRDPREVARELLGKVLVRREGHKVMAGRVVETEAYLGANDAAAHAASGLTARNRVLFGPPGHAYVYFIYGNHYCLNVSCMPEGEAGCVLFRALEPLIGFAEMARRRGIPAESVRRSAKSLRMLTSGPGRLCEALGITRARENGVSMTSRNSPLWIGDDGYRPKRIATTTRVGISKDAHHPLRYLIADNPFVSGTRPETADPSLRSG
jgi:DNA-3-methyladenine glycosylase